MMLTTCPRPLLLLLLIPAACSRSATSTEGQKASTDRPRPPATSPPPAAPQPALPRLKQPHRPVFELADNRLLAHMVREGGLVVPLGQPGTAKYLRFGRPWTTWAIDAREDGKRVGVATRSVSWLDVPLTAKQSKSKVLALHLKSSHPQGLRIKLNGQALEKTRLAPGWQTVEVGIPDGALRSGENRVALRWARYGPLGGHRRAYAAVQWLSIGASEPKQADATQPGADLDLRRDKALWLPRGGGLAYYVFPYPEAKLRLRFSAQPKADSCAVVTELDTNAGPPQRVERRAPPDQAGPSETFVDLTAVAERVTRLAILASGESCDGIQLHEAAIVLPGSRPTVQRGPPPKNVLFWLIDNARADRYRLYKPDSRVETPVIDQLGASGTLFEKPYIAGTESRVSHASLWTGMYPKQHRFIGPKARLNPRWVTLAEAIGKTGLYTAAWTANGNVSEFWGFGQGWRYFRNTLHKGGGLSAKALANSAIKFVRERGSKPFFLYVGTIDPHVSWRARKPWIDRYFP